MFCELLKIRAPSGRTSATAQLGPIGRWPLYGYVYVCFTTCAAEASAASTLPVSANVFVATFPPLSSLRIWLQMSPLDGSAGRGPHLTCSSAAAWIASYSLGATTPRKLFLRTMRTPGMWLIDEASTETICGFVPSP